jgi:hypothetical protein
MTALSLMQGTKTKRVLSSDHSQVASPLTQRGMPESPQVTAKNRSHLGLRFGPVCLGTHRTGAALCQY